MRIYRVGFHTNCTPYISKTILPLLPSRLLAPASVSMLVNSPRLEIIIYLPTKYECIYRAEWCREQTRERKEKKEEERERTEKTKSYARNLLWWKVEPVS